MLGSTLVLSRVATAVGHPELATWPWNRSWFMFSVDDGLHHRYRFNGHLAGGGSAAVDPGRWFAYPIYFDAGRWNAVRRREPDIDWLLFYLCRRYNREAPSEGRLLTIEAVDYVWPQEPGRRHRLSEAADAQPDPYVPKFEIRCPEE